MKFDGFAKSDDGFGQKRVIIRDCGEAEVDQCGEEPEQYANTRATGWKIEMRSFRINIPRVYIEVLIFDYDLVTCS